MLDIIKKIMEAEEESSRLVEAAEAEGRAFLADCRRRARELGVNAEQEAALEARRLLAEASEAATRERDARIRQGCAEFEASLRLEEAVVRRAVAGIVRHVCGPIRS
jgi:vacuolar-type H+-ATPase subunit H